MLPLGSRSALINSPHWPPFMLLGSVGQPSTRRYGLGSLVCWPCTATSDVAIATTTAITVNATRAACDMSPSSIAPSTVVRLTITQLNGKSHQLIHSSEGIFEAEGENQFASDQFHRG